MAEVRVVVALLVAGVEGTGSAVVLAVTVGRRGGLARAAAE